jgi:Bacterial Ig-like domain (group 1)
VPEYPFQAMLSVALATVLTLPSAPSSRTTRRHTQDSAVCGAISVDTTWTTGGVYSICGGGVRVAASVTLTIQPGVTVVADQFGGLTVDGRLVAIGRADSPILMTGAVKTPGYWAGVDIGSFLSAATTASASLSHVTIEYGGSGGSDNLALVRSTVDIDNSVVRRSGKNGLYAGSGSRLRSRSLKLLENGVGSDGFPLVLANIEVEDTVFDGIDITGNGVQAVRLGGGMVVADQHWEYLGVPYRVMGGTSVAADATLTLAPGAELQFEPFSGLTVFGALHAIGAPQQPITFTGATRQAGSWLGIHLSGSPGHEAAANLDHVTVEYGGGLLANINVLAGRAVVRNSIIRNSSLDGARVGFGSALTLEASQITGNAGYGVHMDATADTVIASNNWWGAASGPMSDGACNPGGSGARISQDVVFRPFLTAPGQQPDPFATGDTSLITLTPSRWYAEVSTTDAVTLNVTLRDGNGNPLPNRKIQFASSLNIVQGDGMTDASGNAKGFLTLPLPGENVVTASLLRGQCESGRSAKTRINIKQPVGAPGPLENGPAPYLSPNVTINPLPVVKGITTHVSVDFENPYTVPITLYLQVGYATGGIGVPFQPITFTPSIALPPGAAGVIEFDWVPPIGGHVCIEVRYAYLKPGDPPPPWGPGPNPGGGGIGDVGAPDDQTGAQQLNLGILNGVFKNVQTGAYIQALKQVYKYVDSVGLVIGVVALPEAIPFLLAQDQIMSNATDFLFDKLSHLSCLLQESPDCDSSWDGPAWQIPAGELGNLLNDPPSQDYEILFAPETIALPPAQPAPTVPAARAAALNALAEAQLKTTTHVLAAVVSFDRAAGAAEAQNLTWNDAHMTAYVMYLGQAADWMLITADRIDALIAHLNNEGITDLRMNPASFAAYQQRLSIQGFTAQEVTAGRLVGLDDAGLEAIRASRIVEDASTKTGSLFVQWRQLAAAYRQLANNIKGLPAFTPIQAAPPLRLRTSANATGRLARVYDTTAYLTVGNPYTHSITMDLNVRRVNLPADWIATVSPLTVTLAPSATVPATLTLVPGAAMPQGTVLRVALEGMADGGLVGGYVVEVRVPQQVALPGRQIFLPLTKRA